MKIRTNKQSAMFVFLREDFMENLGIVSINQSASNTCPASLTSQLTNASLIPRSPQLAWQCNCNPTVPRRTHMATRKLSDAEGHCIHLWFLRLSGMFSEDGIVHCALNCCFAPFSVIPGASSVSLNPFTHSPIPFIIYLSNCFKNMHT